MICEIWFYLKVSLKCSVSPNHVILINIGMFVPFQMYMLINLIRNSVWFDAFVMCQSSRILAANADNSFYNQRSIKGNVNAVREI